MSQTIHDFSHYAIHGNLLYIYKTPESTDYTMTVTGVRFPEEVSGGSSYFDLDSDLVWALIYKALEKIAEVNGDDKSSDRYLAKYEFHLGRMRIRADNKNFHLKKVEPWDLT